MKRIKPKFTEEEINLCKEIAKYYRKSLGFADWFYDEELRKIGIHVHSMILEEDMSNKIPLWTWQDAREWLLEQNNEGQGLVGLHYLNLEIHDGFKVGIIVDYHNLTNYEAEGNTDLEAILTIVLLVLKEKNR